MIETLLLPSQGHDRGRCGLKRVILSLTAIGFGLFLPLLLVEVVLRFFPVSEGLQAQSVNEQSPVFHFQPNRVSTFSEHWNFDIVNRVRTNNYGFVHEHDYDAEKNTPLLAVIGDSYIEAAMVPFRDTLQGRLAQDVEKPGRVYSFAASGAPLSQYLIWSEFAKKEFDPDGIVVAVVGNDLTESMLEYGAKPGFHHFKEVSPSNFQLVRVDFTPSMLGRAVRHSSLGMYLLVNLKMYYPLKGNEFLRNPSRFHQVFDKPQRGHTEPAFVANVPAQSSDKDLQAAQKATDLFFDLLPKYSGLPPSRILLVVDGFRTQMYDPKQLEGVWNSFWAKSRGYFIQQAEKLGFEVIDLHPVLMERYSREHKRFEFPTDAHWNSEGHAAVAEAVRESKVFHSVFSVRP